MFHRNKTEHWTSIHYLADQADVPVAFEPELTLDAIGSLQSDGNFSYEQVSSSLTVHVIESGSGVFVADGVPFEASAGDLFAFHPGTHYHYEDRPSSPWLYTWFRLVGRSAGSALDAIGLNGNAPLLRGSYFTALAPSLREITAVFRDGPIALYYPEAAAWRLVSAIANAGVAECPAAARTFADMTKSLIDDDFVMNLSIDEIARRFGTSRSTVFRQFRARFGVSPKEYLDSVRLARARTLLRQSNTAVHEIASLCGYEDSHYFSRAYKRAYGNTPSDERIAR